MGLPSEQAVLVEQTVEGWPGNTEGPCGFAQIVGVLA